MGERQRPTGTGQAGRTGWGLQAEANPHAPRPRPAAGGAGWKAGGGARGLVGPVVGLPSSRLKGWGGVGPGLLPHSLGGPSSPCLLPLLLSFPPLGVRLHMRLLRALFRPALAAQERVPAAHSRWQNSSSLSGVDNS